MALNNQTRTAFPLDIVPGGTPSIIHCSQGDVGRLFTAELKKNGAGWPNESANYNVVLRGIKPDKTVFEYAQELDEDIGVTFSTTEQMTVIPGPVECELVFSQSGNKVASANFILKVEDAPFDENAASESVIESAEDIVHEWLDTNGVTLTLDNNGVVRLTT